MEAWSTSDLQGLVATDHDHRHKRIILQCTPATVRLFSNAHNARTVTNLACVVPRGAKYKVRRRLRPDELCTDHLSRRCSPEQMLKLYTYAQALSDAGVAVRTHRGDVQAAAGGH